MACGLPVIAGAHSTMPELVGKFGTLVEVEDEIYKLYDYEVKWHPLMTEALVKAMRSHVKMWEGGLLPNRSQVRQQAMRYYMQEMITTQWEDLVDSLIPGE